MTNQPTPEFKALDNNDVLPAAQRTKEPLSPRLALVLAMIGRFNQLHFEHHGVEPSSIYLSASGHCLDKTKPSVYLAIHAKSMNRNSDPVAFLVDNYDLIEIKDEFRKSPFSLRAPKVQTFLKIADNVLAGKSVKDEQRAYLLDWLEPSLLDYEALRAPVTAILGPTTP